MATLDSVKRVLGEVLQLGPRAERLGPDSTLLGSLPELDSMAVVSVIMALETEFGIFVEDDEVSASTFESVGSLARFIDQKLGR
jgi:acyl carrier protein